MKKELYYDFYKLEKKHFWFIARRRIIKSVLSKFVDLKNTNNLKALEIGSGTGGNLEYFSKYFNDIKGVEPDKLALELSQSKIETEIKEGGLPYDIPYKDGSFDIILLLDVLEHVEKHKEALVEIKKKLKKGGKLCLTVPAFMFLWSEHDVANYHYRRYNLTEMKDLLKDAGYKINYYSYFNFFLFPLIWLTRLIKKTVKSKDYDIKSPPFLVNFLLKIIMSSEVFWLKFLRFPFGVSIILIASND